MTIASLGVSVNAGTRGTVSPERMGLAGHTLTFSEAWKKMTQASVQTIQELLGHGDVKATMACTPVLNRGGTGVRSPIDTL